MRRLIAVILTATTIIAIFALAAYILDSSYRPKERQGKKKVRERKPVLKLEPNKSYFFVDAEKGNDENAGTEDKPWRTLKRASEVESAGKSTVVVVKKGIYNETLKPRNTGREDAPVEFIAYPGHNVVIDGQGKLEKGINLSGKEHITVQGFTVTGFTDNGITARLESGQKGIKVVNCLVYNNEGHGIYFDDGSDKSITGCVTRDNGKDGIRVVSGHSTVIKNNESYRNLDEDGIYFGDHSGIIEGNVVHDQLKSTNPSAHIDGIQLFQHKDDVNERIIIKNNIFFRIRRLPIMLENYRGVTIEDNLIYKSNNNGINVKNSPETIIRNNLIYKPRYAGLYIHKDSAGCISLKNIIYEAGRENGWAAYGISEDSISGFSSEGNLLSKTRSSYVVGFGDRMVNMSEWQDLGFDKSGGSARSKKRVIEKKLSRYPGLPKENN